MTKIAIIDKAPGKTNYSKYFEFDFDLLHMSDVPLKKLLKKDITLEFDDSEYDYVILVGSEASKVYAKVTSVTNMAGQLVNDKFIPITNPAMLAFKPEGQQDFDRALKRIHTIISGEGNTKVQGNFTSIQSEDAAIEYLEYVLSLSPQVVAVDTETTGLYPRDGYIIGISMSHEEHQGVYIDTDIFDEQCVALLQKICDKHTIVMHNLKFDYKMIQYHLGITFRAGAIHDTMLMHYALDENSSHSLKALALKYTNYGDYDAALDAFKKDYCKTNRILEEDFTYDLIPFSIISEYACIDTSVTLILFNKFYPILLGNDNLLRVYKTLLMEGTLMLIDVEEFGIPFSKERLELANNYLVTEIDKAKEKIYEFKELVDFERIQGKIFNPNSPTQLRQLLFDFLGLESIGKKTGTGQLSTDAEVLEALADQHPLPNAILTVRKLSKLHNTYVSKLIPSIDMDGRVRTGFNLHFTTSGRLSSSGKFNAQQIPRDDPIIKGCIVAPKGYKIISQDLQTGEMYYAAVLSGDTNLQAIFKEGGDFHSAIAKAVFDLPCAVEEVKKLYPELRQSAKAISFGILYGATANKVSETVTKALGKYYSVEQAQDDIDEYFRKFHKLKEWLKDQKVLIETNGYVYSFFGRKRRLANAFSSDKATKAHEVRSGINSLIQSVCSDVNLYAAIETNNICKQRGLDANIFMLVHDSIVSLVREDLVDEYTHILKIQTQLDRGCSIPGTPIGVDTDVGDDYSFGKFEEFYEVRGNSLACI